MKKVLVLIMAVLMIVGINGLVTGCGNKEETKLRDWHGYYGDHAWSACEEDWEDYKNNGVEVSDIDEEYIYGERYYYFYTYTTIAD